MIETSKGRNYNVDIMKFILSIFVVLIHAEVDIGILTPFLRIAVPLFFITALFMMRVMMVSMMRTRPVMRVRTVMRFRIFLRFG